MRKTKETGNARNRFKGNISRRDFLSLSALGLSSLTILPSWKTESGIKIAPSDRVVMGFVGLGQQGCSDFKSFSSCPGVQVAACCDVDSVKRERFRRRVAEWQRVQGMNERCDMYEFYEDLIARKDIDAVEIATPDHWHALIAIEACQAGKDVFCQKPLAYTITEGLAVQTAVRTHHRIFQMGSQQRSSAEFQQAIKLVREKAIGHIDKVYVRVGDPPKPLDLPEMPVPSNLNFNQWLGPLNDPKIHYHPDLCPPISLDPEVDEQLWGAWRWYQETGNGYPADWGAHMYDIVQAALGMDGLGPVEFIPKGYEGILYATMNYADGVVMTDQPFREDRPDDKGIQFIGDKGWLKVARGYIECSDPSLLQKQEQKVEKGQYEVSSPHMQNFIDAVRAHRDPIAPVEYGTSTNTLCCLFNIARELNRPVRWNPALLSFEGDRQAARHRLYYYEYRKPYKLPYLNTRNNL
ncbi:Gfo/Idh/MocA family protein [Phocaeicola abscessus]|uniref:Gfo/Idh/MocA family protein n=1 Tax=Phocaeicola abscessus TaxID=555313 RepID=UPI0003856DED|nr:Gfo/Idh/MocA family oxidoreductase [Phocaeicola abscessus]EPT33084.1 oxidoreductase, NAD-binding domain protein [Bacteroidetes bacterium oral taxon 272 str. F0290]